MSVTQGQETRENARRGKRKKKHYRGSKYSLHGFRKLVPCRTAKNMKDRRQEEILQIIPNIQVRKMD